MKKIFIYILLFQLAFLSCKKSEVEPLFTTSANQRAADAIATYKKQLSDAQYGWKAFYYPDGGNAGGYTFYLKFDATGKVTMNSDFDGINGYSYLGSGYNTAFETTYQLKALQKPTLIFDSYSYISELVNPDYNGGTGQLADLELAYQTVTDDKITFTGNFNSTQMVLTKVTQTEYDALNKGYLKTSFETGIKNIFYVAPFPGGINAAFALDFTAKQGTVYYLKDNSELSITSAFSITATGLHFKDPITIYGITFQDLTLDPVKKVYYLTLNGTRVDLVKVPFSSAMGSFGSIIYFDPTIIGQDANYKALFATINQNIKTQLSSLPNVQLYYVYFEYVSVGVWNLNFSIYSNSTRYNATYTYKVSQDTKGNYSFVRSLTNANGSFLAKSTKPLTDIIETKGNTFNIDYDPANGSIVVVKGVNIPSFVMKGYFF